MGTDILSAAKNPAPAGANPALGDPPAPSSGMAWVLGWAVLFIASGWTFLDYWNYNRMNREDPAEWPSLLAGRGIAPAQYRIGVFRLGAWLAHPAHLQLRHAFAAIDFVCLLAGTAAVLLLLVRTPLFRLADSIARWALAFLCLGLLQFYLLWTFWFQKPETMATFAVLAGTALAASQIGARRPYLAAIAMLALAGLGATVRADAVVALHAGLLLASLLPGTKRMPLGRALQGAVSFLSIGLAAAVQLYIARVLYPGAQRNAAAFQLLENLHSLNGFLVLVLALAPWAATVWLAFRRWAALDGWSCALVLGSLVHFALFYAMGMAEEVRIFLPFAMVLLPLTTPLLFERFVAPHRPPPDHRPA
jgi:hypothetical protein